MIATTNISGVTVNNYTFDWKKQSFSFSDNFSKIKHLNGYTIGLTDGYSFVWSMDNNIWNTCTMSDTVVRDIIFVDDYFILLCDSNKNFNTEPQYLNKIKILKSFDLIEFSEISETYSIPDLDFICGTDIVNMGNYYLVIGVYLPESSDYGDKIYCIWQTIDLINFSKVFDGDVAVKHCGDMSLSFFPKIQFSNSNLVVVFPTYNRSTYSNNYGCCIVSTTDGKTFYKNSESYSSYKSYYYNQCLFSYKNEIWMIGGGEQHDNSVPNGEMILCIKKSINSSAWTDVHNFSNRFTSPCPSKIIYMNNRFLVFTSWGQVKIISELSELSSQLTNCTDVMNNIFLTDTIVVGNKILCVGYGGTMMSSDILISRGSIYISPQINRQELEIYQHDNIGKIYVGAVTRTIDVNIKPENIKQGITILGVTGTYSG